MLLANGQSARFNFLTLVLCSVAFSQNAVRTDEGITLDEILKRLTFTSGISHPREQTNRELIAEIRTRKVDFVLFDDDREAIKKAGGSKELLETIDKALPSERKAYLFHRTELERSIRQNYAGTSEQRELVEKSGLEYLEKYGSDPDVKPFSDWLRYHFGLPVDSNLYTPSVSDCKMPGDPNRAYKTIKPINENDYVGWHQIETYRFTFYVPPELKGGGVKCIEGGCYSFSAGSYSLSVDINYDAGRPSFERGYATYCEKSYVIDSFNAWIWFYQLKDENEGSPFRYEAGALFRSHHDKHLVFNIVLLSKDASINELADKIFSSVKYKKIEQKTATK